MDLNIALKFFGTELDSSFERVIITNILIFYKSISNSATVIFEDHGFYENKKIIFNGSLFRLIKITPGSVIIDVLKVLGQVSKDVTLVGLVGALADEAKLGDIARPSSTLSANGDSFILDGVGDSIIFQTEGLINESRFYEKVKAMGVDFIDMESSYLGYFGRVNNINCRVIGLVSDLPLKTPFYSDKCLNLSEAENSIANLLKLI